MISGIGTLANGWLTSSNSTQTVAALETRHSGGKMVMLTVHLLNTTCTRQIGIQKPPICFCSGGQIISESPKKLSAVISKFGTRV